MNMVTHIKEKHSIGVSHIFRSGNCHHGTWWNAGRHVSLEESKHCTCRLTGNTKWSGTLDIP